MGCGSGVESLEGRERALLLGAVFSLVAASWWWLWAVHGPASGHSGHLALSKATASQSLTLAPVFAMWVAMMVAMMLPPVLPWIWFFAETSRPSPEDGVRWGRVTLFTSGYFTVWAGGSLLAALLQLWLNSAGLLVNQEGGKLAAGLVGAGVLALAGIYQLTPLKSACLRHCRSPLTYFLRSWRDGPAGAYSMGTRHGLFCLGCCWALMGVAFAVGVMNFFWMALLTVLLSIEKIAPGGEKLSRVTGIFLLAWSAWVGWGAV